MTIQTLPSTELETHNPRRRQGKKQLLLIAHLTRLKEDTKHLKHACKAPVQCNTNGANGHDAQTQYEKDIYSQLNDATRDTTESMRVYTAGSEPMHLDSSLEQQLMEAANSTPPLKSYSTEAQQIPSPRHQIQELPSSSNETQFMKTEKLPTPPIHSEELQTTQVVNQSFASHAMQT